MSNQASPQNIKIQFGDKTIELTGFKTIVSVIVLALIGAIWYVYSEFSQGAEKKAQREHLRKNTQTIHKTLRYWNEYKGNSEEKLDGIKTEAEAFFAEHLDGLVALFDDTSPALYEPAFRLWFYHHYARLLLARGDIREDVGDLKRAVDAIDSAQKLIVEHINKDSKVNKYMQSVHKFGGISKFMRDFRRDQMVIYALYFYYSQSMKAQPVEDFKSKATTIRDKHLDCNFVTTFTLVHREIISVLEC